MGDVKTVRVWFQKTGAAKYISHLDLTRCMARALKLSGLPVWYTEGFNPHIYMTFGMPLSLGTGGLRECMDIRLTEEASLEDAAEQLRRHLPQDISVLSVTIPEDLFDAVAYGEYELRLEAEDPEYLWQKLQELLAQDVVLVKKRTKKGEKEVDVKPHFTQIESRTLPGWLVLLAVLHCGPQGSVNPSLLLEALEVHKNLRPYGEITRCRLLKKDFSDIR